MLTNLIHFLDLLNYFSNFTSLSKKKLRIINSTSKNYKELVGTIISENRKNKLKIETKNFKKFLK